MGLKDFRLPNMLKIAAAGLTLGAASLVAAAQSAGQPPLQPPGAAEALAGIASQPAAHTSMTFDREMLENLLSQRPLGALNSVTVENYRYHQNAFYLPENVHALINAYDAAGWKHLVDANTSPRESASPTKAITDMWLHFRGTDIDGVTVLVRSPRDMSVIEVSGVFRPLDLIHLSGHFGIPKIDSSAVMVPAPAGR